MRDNRPKPDSPSCYPFYCWFSILDCGQELHCRMCLTVLPTGALTFGDPVVPLVNTRVARSSPWMLTGFTDRFPALESTSLKDSTGQPSLETHSLLGSPHSTITNFSWSLFCTQIDVSHWSTSLQWGRGFGTLGQSLNLKTARNCSSWCNVQYNI